MNLELGTGGQGTNLLRFVLAAVVAVGLVIIFVGGLVVYFLVSTTYGSCTEGERKVYAEFPQFGNVEREPQPFSESGGCSVFYDTRTSQERVAHYYTKQLEAHGWEVEPMTHETTVFEGKQRTFEEVEITARRGDFFYNVLFESHAYYDPPRPGVHVAVHVFENKDAPPPCGSEEKAALAEFPHYGDTEVGRDLGTFSLRGKPEGFCVTTYPAQGASRGQVLSYYEEKLTEHGWKVKQFSTKRGGRIEASRNGLRYVVHYSRFPEEDATDIRIEVYKG